jgi:hypothetical protein
MGKDIRRRLTKHHDFLMTKIERFANDFSGTAPSAARTMTSSDTATGRAAALSAGLRAPAGCNLDTHRPTRAECRESGDQSKEKGRPMRRPFAS